MHETGHFEAVDRSASPSGRHGGGSPARTSGLRAPFFGLVLLASLLLGGCCAQSNLGSTYASLRSVLVQTAVPRQPSLMIAEPDHNTDVAQIPGEARSFMATQRTRRELERAASRERMGALLAASLVEQLEADHAFEVVTDPAQPHDAVLRVEVRRFGLENDLDQTHLSSFYRVRASLRDARPAGGALLWRRCGSDRSAVESPPGGGAPRGGGDGDEDDDGERIVDDGVLDLGDLRELGPGDVAYLFAWIARDMGRFVSRALADDAGAAGP